MKKWRSETIGLDLTVLRTRALLQEAYLRLMEKYEEAEITVSMIAEEANINRATFYAHYFQ